MIHGTDGSFAGALSWFANPEAKVSAHYLIRASDGTITQLVAEAERAVKGSAATDVVAQIQRALSK